MTCEASKEHEGRTFRLRPACPPADLGSLMPRSALGRVSDVSDFAAPVVYGLASWAVACRLTWVMRWLKPGDDEGMELDPVG